MFGERLKRARLKEGLSLDKLSEKANNIVSKQAISQYEKNKKNPSSIVLIALANALNIKIEYFFRTTNVEIGQVDFRKHSTFGKKKQETIKEKVREYLERYIEIEEILEFDGTFDNPLKDDYIETYDYIEELANKLRKEWELGNDPIGNVIEMLELKNIKVILLKDESKFNGLSGWANDNEKHLFIVLNDSDSLSADRKRFTALHELGHLLLKNHDLDDEEKISNRFAGAFLFPKERVKQEFGDKRTKITFEELKHIKQKYKMSIASIMMRLRQADVISEAMYKRFYIIGGRKLDNDYLLEHKEEVNRFDNLLGRLYSEQLISLSKLAELSGKSVEDALEIYGEVV